MLYFLSSTKNSYGWLGYDHDHSMDYSWFFDDYTPLKDLESKIPLRYIVTKKSYLPQIMKSHVINSTGPTLVSDQLRDIIERLAPDKVEFLRAAIEYDGQAIEGFSCIHPFLKLDCIDMEKSEYSQTNFDPREPAYAFGYMCVQEQPLVESPVGRCLHMNRQLIVNDEFKSACKASKIKGLLFYRAIDLTPEGRDVFEKI